MERGADTRVATAAGRALRNNYEKSLWYLNKKQKILSVLKIANLVSQISKGMCVCDK